MKKTFFSLLILGAAAFTLFFASCQTTRHPPVPEQEVVEEKEDEKPQNEEPIEETVPPVQEEVIPAVSAYESVHIQEKLDYIITDITYPRFPDNKELSAAIERFVQKDYPAIKAEASETYTQHPFSLLTYQYLADYEVIEDKIFTCVLLTIYTYTDGAHGLETNKSFVWNKKIKAFQNVAEASGLSYAEISAKCRAALKKRDFYTGDGSMEAGTQPDDEHLGTFTIDGKKLTIYFAPYAVAPYSEGTQTVIITLP